MVWTYIKAVARHWVWTSIFLVGVVGDVATIHGSFAVPRWAWWACTVAAVMIAQFRAYGDVFRRHAVAQARLGELDSAAARKAYADEAIRQCRDLLDEAHEEGFADQWFSHHTNRMTQDIVRLETEIRAQIRQSSGAEAARRFDSSEAGDEDTPQSNSFDDFCSYIERRIARLEEWKATL